MRLHPNYFALRTALLYAGASALWITLSDWALVAFVQEPEAIRHLSMFKGGAFVLVTSVLLFGLVRYWTGRVDRHLQEQKRIERDLRESEERFRAVVESIHEVFWIADPADGRILYLSPAFQDIWGRPVSALIEAGKETFLQTIHEEDRERVRAAWDASRADTRAFEAEYRVARPDGSIRWVHDQAVPVKDGAGRLVRIVGVAEDITERKQLEAQFLRAQRMEAIGTLAGGVAHDLNNILAPMLMAAGLLKEKVADEHDREMLAMVERSARRGADILRQLLTFSRGVEGARMPLPIRHLIREIAGIVRETFPREITLVEHVPSDLFPVVADATQLHQVLVNLCVNARDAMPAGGTLTLRATNAELTPEHARTLRNAVAGPYVVITIADTGVGIAPQIIDRIFDPFFTTKPVGKGTGLGLSTALGIVRSHGGFITVASEEGKGSTFTVHLPAALGETDDPPSVAAEALPIGRGETILVVDDEEPIREATRHVLEKQNYHVLTATNGKEAVSAFLEGGDEIRLVLTDVMMPQMGGAALLRALRLINPQLKAVAISGLQPDEERRNELAALGVTQILPKPCGPKALLDAIQQVLASE